MEKSGTSWSSQSWDEKKSIGDSGFLKPSEFESERFFSSTPFSRSNDYCPYSLRQSQLSTAYQYDVLLVYDPEENTFYTEKLMEYLRPQNLKIFDFARDAPPGLPQRKVLQSTLQVCRYTCIVITKKFISNFWLQLRTDMSIQDMLDNEQKMYSVIVVVMDAAVKKADLPLDLATLSPLFFTEKFFENRIKLAFGKSMPFPSAQPSSGVLKSSEAQEPPKYNDIPTSRFDTRWDPEVLSVSNLKGPPACTLSNAPISRLPREHGDGTYVMPPSFISSVNPKTFDSSLAMLRTSSVTVSSTGSRQPQETLDSCVQSTIGENTDFIMNAKKFLDSIKNESDDLSVESDDLEISQSIRGDDFSSLNQTEQGTGPANGATFSIPDFEGPTFFSIGEPSVIGTTASELSELEISSSTLPSMSVDEAQRLGEPRCKSVVEAAQEKNKTLDLADNASCASLPAQLTSASPNLSENKKSRSMKSLVGSKLSKFSKSLSFRTKNK